MQESVQESPPLRAIRRVWGDYQTGVAKAEDVFLVLQANSDFGEFQVAQLSQQIENEKSSEAKASLTKILQAFELHLDAVEQMYDEFESDGQGQFEAGLAVAVRANCMLWEAQQTVQGAVAQAEQVFCPFCGHQQRRGQEGCQRCSRKLPAVNQAFTGQILSLREGPSAQKKLTQNAAEVSAAVEAWTAGRLSVEQCLAICQQVEQRLDAHWQALAKEVQPSPASPEARTMDLLNESLDAIQDLIAVVRADDKSECQECLDLLLESSAGLAEIAAELAGQA